MSISRTPNWLKNVLLLGALAAGTMTAQLMPAYQEHVGKITYPSAAQRSPEEPASEGYSQANVQPPTLAMRSGY